MTAGKTAVRDGIGPFPGQTAQPVFDPPHGFDMHDPVPAERHPDQAQHILPAPVIDQPGCAFVFTDAAGAPELFLHFVPECPSEIGVLQLFQHPVGGPHHFLRVTVQRRNVQLPGKHRDLV